MRHTRMYTVLGIALCGVIFFVVLDRISAPIMDEATPQYAEGYIHRLGKEIPPQSFTADGCTLFPESFLGSDWSSACLSHDIAYWSGGTKEERLLADTKLRTTVAESGAFGRLVSPLMYTGVRLWGDTWLTRLFDAHWGFGWN